MGSIAVIGGGVLGLSIAQGLVRRGHEITVIEAAPELGGLAAAWRIGDVTWDRHNHVILLTDRRTRAMLASIGLERELRWVQTNTVYYNRYSILRSVYHSVEFLRRPGLVPIDKARLESFVRQVGALFCFAKGALLCIAITFFAVVLLPQQQGEQIVAS